MSMQGLFIPKPGPAYADQTWTKHRIGSWSAQVGLFTANRRQSREPGSARDTRVRATSVPERAENDGLQRSPTDSANGLPPGRAQVDPLRETTF